MDSYIKEIATDVAKIYYSKQGDVHAHVGIDPALVLLTAEIILEVIKLVRSCNETPEDSQKMCSNPSAFQKMLLKKAVKEHLDIQDKIVVKRLTDAIIDRGASVTVEEIEKLS